MILSKTSDDAIFYITINNNVYEIMNEFKENVYVYDKTTKIFQIRWINPLSENMNAILYTITVV